MYNYNKLLTKWYADSQILKIVHFMFCFEQKNFKPPYLQEIYHSLF